MTRNRMGNRGRGGLTNRTCSPWDLLVAASQAGEKSDASNKRLIKHARWRHAKKKKCIKLNSSHALCERASNHGELMEGWKKRKGDISKGKIISYLEVGYTKCRATKVSISFYFFCEIKSSGAPFAKKNSVENFAEYLKVIWLIKRNQPRHNI